MPVFEFMKNGVDISWDWEKRKSKTQNNPPKNTNSPTAPSKNISVSQNSSRKTQNRDEYDNNVRKNYSENVKDRQAEQLASQYTVKELKKQQDVLKAKLRGVQESGGRISYNINTPKDTKNALQDEIKKLNDSIEIYERARVKRTQADDDNKKNSYEALKTNSDFEEKSKPVYKDEMASSVHAGVVGGTYYRGDFIKNDAKIGIHPYIGYMNDDEKDIYNYLYNTKGEKDAEEYIEFIRRNLNERQAIEESKMNKKYAKEHPVDATVSTILSTPVRGVSGVIGAVSQNVKNNMTGRTDTIDINSDGFALERFTQETREGITEDMSGFGAFLYNTGVSIGENLVTLPFGGTITIASMAGSAFSSSAYDATKRGATAEQALAMGITSALVEGLTEKIGLDNLFKVAKGGIKGAKQVVAEALKQAGIEGTEELISEIANTLMDNAIMGEKSNYNINLENYVADGKSLKESQKLAMFDVLKNVGMAFASGALSGGVMGTGASTIGYINTKQSGKVATTPSTEVSSTNPQGQDTTVKAPVSTEGGISLPVTQATVESAMERILNGTATNRDIDLFKLANAQNRAMFENATGVKLPGTNSLTRKFLRGYAENQTADTTKAEVDTTTVQGVKNDLDVKNTEPTMSVQDAQMYNIATSNLIRKARENNLDLQTFYAETENVNAYNLTEQDIQTINNAFAKMFGNNVDENTQGNLNVLSKIANKYPINVNSSQQTETMAEGQNVALNNPLNNDIMNTNGGVQNVINESGTFIENGERFGKIQAGIRQDTLQKEGTQPIISREEKVGFGRTGHSKTESRAIGTVIDTPEFELLARFVGNEMSEKLSIEMYEFYLEDTRLDEGYDLSEVIAYDMLSNENNELRKLFADSIDEYFNINKSSVNIDSTGAKVSEEVLKKTANSVVRNSNGQLVPLYHGTDSNYSVLLPGDIGIHFGSYAQASELARSKEISSPIFVKAYLNITNPLVVEHDSNGWNAAQIVTILESKGIIDRDTARSIREKGISKTENEKLVKLLQSKGYDGIIYTNEYEAGSGTAYIVFEDSQVIRIDNNSNSNSGTKYDLSRDEQRWTTERVNKSSESGRSIGNIVDYIRNAFDIPISSGKVENKNARGVYKVRAESIRTKISNNLPTVSHELGHHLDKLYKLSSLPSINDLIANCDQDFLNLYKPEERSGEAVAEFIREYLKNTNTAKNMSPQFYGDFLNVIGAEDLKSLNIVADYVNTYMSSDFDERVQSSIVSSVKTMRDNLKDFSQHPTETMKEEYDKRYTEWVDTFYPQKQAMDYVKKVNGNNIDVSKDAYVLATNSLNSATIANHIVTKGMTDMKGNTNIGKSLLESIKEVKSEDLNAFDEYLVLNHSLEWIQPKNGKRKRVFADETLEDIDNINKEIAKLEQEHPEFIQAAKNIYEYQQNVLKYFVVDAGGMSYEGFKKMQELYPKYVPFNRDVNSKMQGKTKGTFANQKIPFKRAKGSGLEIISPLESIIMNTEKMVKFAQRNQVMRVWAEYADTVDGFGKFMEKVAPDMLPHAVDMTKKKGEIFKYLEEHLNASDYITLTDAIDDILGNNAVGFSPIANANKKIVSVLKNGKMDYYQIHDENFYNSIANMSPQQAWGLHKWSARIMNPMKILTTQNNPLFAPVNSIRDIGTAYKNSIINNPVEFIARYVSSFGGIVTKSDAWKKYQSMGGGHSSELSASVRDIKQTLRKIELKDKGIAQKFLSGILHPVQTIASFNDFIESVPRFMEFKKTLDSGGDTQQAIYNADDITTNFKRGGYKAKNVNDIVLYFNAALQGLDKMTRSFKDAPPKQRAARVTKYITIALMMTALQGLFNRDDEEEYNNLSSYKKNNFYNFSIGDGYFVSIPKARELALLDSTTERIAEYVFGNKEAFEGFGGYVLDSLVLPGLPKSGGLGGAQDVLGDTVAGPFIDVIANEDFKGSPIESYSDKYLRDDYRTNEIYSESTTKFAKWLGNTSVMKNWEISPKQIDHIANNYTGVIGQINRALFPVNEENRDWTLGLKNKFVSDSYYSTDVLNDVYDTRDTSKKKYRNAPTYKNAMKYEQDSLLADYATNLNKTVKALSKEEQREGRKSMVDAINSWDYDTGFEHIVGSRSRDVNEDYVSISLPDAEFEYTDKKKKYTYTFTPNEYKEYIDAYMKLLEKERKEASTHSWKDNYDEILQEADDEAMKEIKAIYKKRMIQQGKSKLVE